MKTVTTIRFLFARPALLAAVASVALAGLVAEASAAGFTVEKIGAPGPAVRMSSAGYLTGTYQVKCSHLGGKPNYRICYYAPWYYDGARVTKVSWPVDWNFVYSLGINDSLELIGREYRGSVSSGGWLYSGDALTYSGSLPGGGGSLLAAINNNGVAVGTAQSANRVSRAATFQDSGAGYTLEEVQAFDPTVPTSGADINDAGDIAGTFTGNDGSQHAFAYVAGTGTAIAIPDLPGASYCQALRISQADFDGLVWVAGNCGDRGFVYQTGGDTDQLIELNNLDDQSGAVSVQSVNAFGEAVGTVAGKAVLWMQGDSRAIDLNQYAPKRVSLSRGIDINDAGTILASYTDSSGNVSTYLLTP